MYNKAIINIIITEPSISVTTMEICPSSFSLTGRDSESNRLHPAGELFRTQTHTSPVEEYQVTFGTTQKSRA
jgi:hypothetical protein